MKNLTFCLLILSMSAFISTQINAATTAIPTYSDPVPTTQSAEANLLIARLNVLKAMDKTTLNFSEKRVLRKEVRSIKNELRRINGGIYISGGALLVIVILLVLLL